MMPSISKHAGLSTVYTNHSVRASTVTTLYRAGVPAQSIMAITKHKNASSLSHYVSEISDAQKRGCSDVLTKSFQGTTTTSFLPSTSKDVSPASMHNDIPDFDMFSDEIFDAAPQVRVGT